MRIFGVFDFKANCANYISLLSFNMSSENANWERSEGIREEDRRDDISGIVRGEAGTGDIRKDLGLLPNWTLHKYCCECAGMIDVGRFDFLAVDSRNLVIYDRNCFERDTDLGAWKRC